MLPLITFASGLVAGIVGVRLLKQVKTPDSVSVDGLVGKARTGLDKAQSGLRDATVSSLSAIEKSSAGLRAKLEPKAEPAPAPAAEAEKAAAAVVKTAKAAPRRRAAPKKKPAAAPKPESEA